MQSSDATRALQGWNWPCWPESASLLENFELTSTVTVALQGTPMGLQSLGSHAWQGREGERLPQPGMLRHTIQVKTLRRVHSEP